MRIPINQPVPSLKLTFRIYIYIYTYIYTQVGLLPRPVKSGQNAWDHFEGSWETKLSRRNPLASWDGEHSPEKNVYRNICMWYTVYVHIYLERDMNLYTYRTQKYIYFWYQSWPSFRISCHMCPKNMHLALCAAEMKQLKMARLSEVPVA